MENDHCENYAFYQQMTESNRLSFSVLVDGIGNKSYGSYQIHSEKVRQVTHTYITEIINETSNRSNFHFQ